MRNAGIRARKAAPRRPTSNPLQPRQQRLQPGRLDMQPEAGVGPREKAAEAGEQDGGGGRAGGEIGGRPLHERARRVRAFDVDRGPAVVERRRASAVAVVALIARPPLPSTAARTLPAHSRQSPPSMSPPRGTSWPPMSAGSSSRNTILLDR